MLSANWPYIVNIILFIGYFLPVFYIRHSLLQLLKYVSFQAQICEILCCTLSFKLLQDLIHFTDGQLFIIHVIYLHDWCSTTGTETLNMGYVNILIFQVF